MAKQSKPTPVHLAAKLYGCPVEEMLSYREYDDGSVVIIAPTGQKFTYSAHSIMECALKSTEISTPAAGPIPKPNSYSAPHSYAAPHSCAATDLENLEEQPLPGSSITAPRVGKKKRKATAGIKPQAIK